MSFWKTSDGQETRGVTEFDSGGGNMAPIPEGTTVLGACVDAKFAAKDESNDVPHLELTWTVLAPQEYANRRIWQKLHIEGMDAKKRDKARRMLAAIDGNFGGNLAKSETAPTIEAVQAAFLNKPLQLKLGLWEMNGKQGNWVMAVAPKGTPVAAAPKPEAAAAPSKGGSPTLGF